MERDRYCVPFGVENGLLGFCPSMDDVACPDCDGDPCHRDTEDDAAVKSADRKAPPLPIRSRRVVAVIASP